MEGRIWVSTSSHVAPDLGVSSSVREEKEEKEGSVLLPMHTRKGEWAQPGAFSLRIDVNASLNQASRRANVP